MQRRSEANSLERRLAEVVIGEVLKTAHYQRRDPEELITTKFVREAFDEADVTVPYDFLYESQPYEMLEVIVPQDDLDTIPFDLIVEEEAPELCASMNLVAVEGDKPKPLRRATTVQLRSRPQQVGLAAMIAAFVIGAFGMGLAIAFFGL